MESYNEKSVDLSINSLTDVVVARRKGLNLAMEMGFSTPDATKIAVVISELGRNIMLYAKGGHITFTLPNDGEYFKIIAEDQGPGIENLDLVMSGSYTSSQGLGLGISGSQRLMDDFDVQTEQGKGTKITAVKQRR